MPAIATNKKQVTTTTTTTKKPAAKKPAAPKTTSAAKKAVAKVSAGVKAKAAALKKPAVSVEKAEPQTPADTKQVVTGWSVKGYPIVKVEAPAKKSGNFSEIEAKHDSENVESLTAKVFPEKLREVEQDLAEGISRLKGFLNGNRIQDSKAALDQLEDIIKDLKDAEGNLLIEIKPKKGSRKTVSKENGVSALRTQWALLIDRPEGATREELRQVGLEMFPELNPKTIMGQLSQLRIGYDYGRTAGKLQKRFFAEYGGRKGVEINGVYKFFEPAEEDYRKPQEAKTEKTVGPIEMIGSDGRVWAGTQMVG